MQQTAVETCVRRICKRSIGGFIVLLVLLGAAVAAIMVLVHPDLENIFIKPAPIQANADLRQYMDKGLYFVEQEGLQVYDTGYYTTTDGKHDESYLLLRTEIDTDPDALVRYPEQPTWTDDWTSIPIKGYVTTLGSYDREARDGLMDDVKSANPDMSYADIEAWVVDGVIIVQSSSARYFAMGGGVLVALLALLLIIMIIRSAGLRGNYREHKACRKLEASALTTIDELESALEADEQARTALATGKEALVATPNFVVANPKHALQVRRASDLMWVCPVTTQHSYNFIPTHKSYSLKLFFCNGVKDMVLVPCKNKKSMNALTESIVQTYGNRVFVGFSDEWQKRHSKDFQGFVEQWRALGTEAEQAAAIESQTVENDIG